MENEKLVTQQKELRKQLKESEQVQFIKHETIAREMTILKSQMQAGGDWASTDLTIAKQRARIESLESELSITKHTFAATEEESKLQIIKLEAQLNDTQITLDKLSGADPEHIKNLRVKNALEKEKFNSYIMELEDKLEWALLNQDTERSALIQISRLESENTDLRSDLESLSKLKNIASIKRQPIDIRRIKDLERKVAHIQQEKSITSLNLNEIMTNVRPGIDGIETIRHFKNRLHSVEQELKVSKTEACEKEKIIFEQVYIK